MLQHGKAPREVVLTRLLRLNARIHGVVTGVVFGLAIFVATNWLIMKGGQVIGPHLSLLGQFFVGYSVTLGGSFIGLLYGFVFGYGLGYMIAAMYNWFLEFKDTSRSP